MFSGGFGGFGVIGSFAITDLGSESWEELGGKSSDTLHKCIKASMSADVRGCQFAKRFSHDRLKSIILFVGEWNQSRVMLKAIHVRESKEAALGKTQAVIHNLRRLS